MCASRLAKTVGIPWRCRELISRIRGYIASVCEPRVSTAPLWQPTTVLTPPQLTLTVELGARKVVYTFSSPSAIPQPNTLVIRLTDELPHIRRVELDATDVIATIFSNVSFTGK